MPEPIPSNPGEIVSPAAGPERRRQVRHICDPRPFLQLLVRPSFICRRAFVHNASEGGLGLVLQHPLEPGSVVALQLRRALHGVSRILSARVVHATPFPGGGWLIGCQLSSPLPPNEL
jgi:PilZ domain